MFDNRLQPSNEPLIPSSYTTTEQPQHLFALTEEEVKELTPVFSRLLSVKLYDLVSFLPYDLPIETIENLLTRIKQWQDERNK